MSQARDAYVIIFLLAPLHIQVGSVFNWVNHLHEGDGESNNITNS